MYCLTSTFSADHLQHNGKISLAQLLRKQYLDSREQKVVTYDSAHTETLPTNTPPFVVRHREATAIISPSWRLFLIGLVEEKGR